MKCIKNITDGNVLRLPDAKAQKLVNSGNYEFCGKSEWKAKEGKQNIGIEKTVSEPSSKVHGLKAKDRRKQSKKKK